MGTEKIYYSPHPDINLPETSCWHFVFDNPNLPGDDKAVFVDGLTDKEIK
jgi:4-coumarate--CoA ligase